MFQDYKSFRKTINWLIRAAFYMMIRANFYLSKFDVMVS